MRTAKHHPLIRRPTRGNGLPVAFGAAVAVLAAGIGVVLFAPELAWLLVNVAVLSLPTFWAVVVARELIRLGMAAAFGFKLFGIQWGCGASLGRRRWGKVHHRFFAIPLGADARFASSRLRQHRLGRWSIRIAPLVAQLIGAAASLSTGALSIDSLSHGFSPLAMIQFANVALLAVHVLIPFELQSGLISDLRLMSVLAVANVEDDRVARASALTMRIETLLEAGDIAGVERQLHDAIARLGREPMLIHFEDRLERIGHAPDPASAAYADAVCDPFEHAWATWDRDSRPLSIYGRALKNIVRFAPISIAGMLVFVTQYDALTHSAHAGWVDEALSISVGQDAGACGAYLSTYEDRLSRLTLISKIPRPLQIQELNARAALSACAGDYERAVRDQSLAVEIADMHRKEDRAGLAPDAPQRVEAERIHSSELRQLGAWHAAQGAYRDALRATRHAEQELNRAHGQVTAAPPSSQRDWALAILGGELDAVEQTRRQILAHMDVRG